MWALSLILLHSYWIYHENGGKNNIVKYAAETFLHEGNIKDIFDADSLFLAITNIRFQISSSSFRYLIPEEIENQLVSHGYVIECFPNHMEYFYSGHPPEPLLAEAAAQSLYMPDVVGKVIKKLDKVMSAYIMEKGGRGELVARLLLTLAHDRAVRELELKTGITDNQARFTRPISVVDFIKALISEEYHDDVLNSPPEKHHKTAGSFKEEFSNAYVNFTHFLRADDSSVANTTFVWKALVRSAAIQCCHDQPNVDIIIPIVFSDGGPEKAVVKEENISAILVQVKNRDSGSEKVAINADEIDFFKTKSEDKRRPYLAIVMELGERKLRSLSNIRGGKSKATPKEIKLIEVPNRAGEPKTRGDDSPNPKYNILMKGTEGIYKGISSSDDAALTRLLLKKGPESEYSFKGNPDFVSARQGLMVTINKHTKLLR